MHAYVLVDYYNLPRKLLNAGLASLVAQIDTLVRTARSDTEEVFVRLYGGWYDDSGLSNQGTVLAQDIAKNFPRSIRGPKLAIFHTHCEIASSLLERTGDLYFATVRAKRGMPRLNRTPPPAACIDNARCTASCVIEWSRKGCPTAGCPVSNSDAFITKQQKLVDVLLCCDLLTVAKPGSSARVFLVSEDDDFIPALILARAQGANVWHVRSQLRKIRLYDAILLRNGVNITFI